MMASSISLFATTLAAVSLAASPGMASPAPRQAPRTEGFHLEAVHGFKRILASLDDPGRFATVCALELIPDDADELDKDRRRRAAVESRGATFLSQDDVARLGRRQRRAAQGYDTKEDDDYFSRLGIESANFEIFGSPYPQFLDDDPTNDVLIEHYNPTSYPLSGDGADIVASALNAWNGLTPLKLELSPAYHDRCGSLIEECGRNHWMGQHTDGYNDIVFYNLDSSSTLGVAWSVSGKEADLAINTDFVWSIDPAGEPGKFDLPSVLIHELGHVVGIGHSSYNDAIMYYALSPNYVNRDLHFDDKNALIHLYGELDGPSSSSSTTTTKDPTTTTTTTTTPSTTTTTTPSTTTTTTPSTTPALPEIWAGFTTRVKSTEIVFVINVRSQGSGLAQAQVDVVISYNGRWIQARRAQTNKRGKARYKVFGPEAGEYTIYIVDVSKQGYHYPFSQAYLSEQQQNAAPCLQDNGSRSQVIRVCNQRGTPVECS